MYLKILTSFQGFPTYNKFFKWLIYDIIMYDLIKCDVIL